MLNFLHHEDDSICFETLFNKLDNNENKEGYVFELAAKAIFKYENNDYVIKNPSNGNTTKCNCKIDLYIDKL